MTTLRRQRLALERISKNLPARLSLIPNPSPGGRREHFPLPLGEGLRVREIFETASSNAIRRSGWVVPRRRPRPSICAIFGGMFERRITSAHRFHRQSEHVACAPLGANHRLGCSVRLDLLAQASHLRVYRPIVDLV